MGKLHEVIAVEGDLAGTAKKIIDEARDTFAKKPTLFMAEHIVTTYFDDAQAHLNMTESTAMVTTVQDKLDYVAPFVARYWDVYASKEATNRSASADLVVNGVVLLPNLPATVLLGLESKLKELRSMYEAIPTLAPGLKWEQDPESGADVYRTAEPELRHVTANTLIPIELSPATKEHKAQVQAVSKDVPVAKKEVTKQSGMLSPAQKSDLLERIDQLIRGAKEARQRANNIDAVEQKGFGKTLFDFIHG